MALRLGLRQIAGFAEAAAAQLRGGPHGAVTTTLTTWCAVPA